MFGESCSWMEEVTAKSLKSTFVLGCDRLLELVVAFSVVASVTMWALMDIYVSVITVCGPGGERGVDRR